MVICLERGATANLHMAQLMPLPLTVSCFSKIQIGSTFLVPAHLGSPVQRAVKRVCVCVTVYSDLTTFHKFKVLTITIRSDADRRIIGELAVHIFYRQREVII